MNSIVQIENVSKKYCPNAGNFNISCQIKEGEIYAIIGPNGAGKTTLIRQILGFIKSDQGSIKVMGHDAWQDRNIIINDIAYVGSEVQMFGEYTGKEYLELAMKFKNNVSWEYVEKLITYFELDVKQKIKKMSTGMKRKVSIIAAFMGKPKILIMDEPTSGLDPIMQKRFNNLVLNLQKENHSTFIICSHIFQEIAKLASRVGFFKSGELIQEYAIESNDISALEEKFNQLHDTEVEL